MNILMVGGVVLIQDLTMQQLCGFFLIFFGDGEMFKYQLFVLIYFF